MLVAFAYCSQDTLSAPVLLWEHWIVIACVFWTVQHMHIRLTILRVTK